MKVTIYKDLNSENDRMCFCSETMEGDKVGESYGRTDTILDIIDIDKDIITEAYKCLKIINMLSSFESTKAGDENFLDLFHDIIRHAFERGAEYQLEQDRKEYPLNEFT